MVLSQLVLVSTLTPHVRRGCSRALMAAPRAQRATRALYASLGWVGMPLPLPLAPFARPDAVAECATIVHWLQLGFGLLLPLYLSALSTAAAFREHQRQRAAAQLPPERGIMAAFYTAVDEWVGPDGTFPPAVLGWVMLAVRPAVCLHE